MADLTECPVCFDEFKEPKLLPCSHTFCAECLGKVKMKNRITCPMCNTKHRIPERGVTAFTENQTMVQLIADRKKLKEVEERLKIELQKKQAEPAKVKNTNEDQSDSAQGQVKVKTGVGAIPKVKQGGKVEAGEEDSLTFIRQKLALIQSKYDPKCCHYCQKVLSPRELKACSKCETAMYCCKTCQTKDWSGKHKVDCKEIQRLKTITNGEDIGELTEENKVSLTCNVKNIGVPEAELIVSEQKISRSDANLVTFSRQKLALIQCEYNPKCCNFCKKVLEQLRTCSKCKTAKYCSKECQVTDWSQKHKAHCKEIRRLEELIQRESSATTIQRKTPGTTLKAIQGEMPWFLEHNMMCSRMCILGNKLLLCGNDEHLGNVVAVYDITTHVVEGTAIYGNIIFGLCVVKIDNKQYIGISTVRRWKSITVQNIEVWSYPSHKLFCEFPVKPIMHSYIHYFEGTLLLANELDKTIGEINATSSLFKFTGLNIPTGLPQSSLVQDMCVLKHGEEKSLVITYIGEGGKGQIKCLDYRGHELWKMNNQSLDGRPFQPLSICTDGNGRIFTSESESNRVIVILEDLSLQTVFVAPGRVWCVTWCDVTSRLFVLHSNKRDTRKMISTFSVREE